MEIKDLNENELELVKKEMLRDYDIGSITLEEYCKCHVRRCDNCNEIFFVDYNDNCEKCYKCYKEYLENEKETDFNFNIDMHDVYVDDMLSGGM